MSFGGLTKPTGYAAWTGTLLAHVRMHIPPHPENVSLRVRFGCLREISLVCLRLNPIVKPRKTIRSHKTSLKMVISKKTWHLIPGAAASGMDPPRYRKQHLNNRTWVVTLPSPLSTSLPTSTPYLTNPKPLSQASPMACARIRASGQFAAPSTKTHLRHPKVEGGRIEVGVPGRQEC